MPTEPVEELLRRTIEPPGLEQTLAGFGTALDEMVNFGTHVLKWCLDLPRGDVENLPLPMLLRHFLELADAASMNIRVGSADPCKLLLRGALESLFAVEYILEDDTQRRSIAFLVYWQRRNLRQWRKYDPSTREGHRFREAIKKDQLIGKMVVPVPDDAAEHVANISRRLQEPPYREVELEYQRLRKQKRSQGEPRWYSLFGGPRNLWKLAEHLKLTGLYEVLYRPWSEAAHATDVIEGKFSVAQDGKGGVFQIRSPRDAQSVTSMALSMGIDIFRRIAEHFGPDYFLRYKSWYSREIRHAFVQLASGRFITIAE